MPPLLLHTRIDIVSVIEVTRALNQTDTHSRDYIWNDTSDVGFITAAMSPYVCGSRDLRMVEGYLCVPTT